MDLVNQPHGVGNTSVACGDASWLRFYPPDVPATLEYPEVPVSHLLESAAQRFPDRAGCTLYGEPTTYTELADKAHRFARTLHDMGAGPGKAVGMLLPNIPEYLIALQATWLTGATALQLSPLMVPEELEKWLAATDCHIVVTLDLLAPSIMGGLKNGGPLEHLIVACLAGRIPGWKSWLYWIERVRHKGPMRLRDTDHFHRFEHLLPPPDGELHPNIRPSEDIALLAPTGGTTASPKAVMLTHRNLVANAMQLRVWSRQPEGQGSVLGVLPFFHAYGLSVCALCSMAMGGTIHLHPRYETKAVLEILEREKVEFVPAVPAMLNALNAEMRHKPRDLSFIRAVISGASPLTNETRKEFESHGAHHVVEGYGLTEASPVTHCNPLTEQTRPGTIGLPLPDTQARIMDEETGLRELPNGEVGELVIRGPQVMKGYFNNPRETALTLRDGWLYTGDIACRDDDGYFTIVDRKKDIIKTSGFLVFPAEVEEVLMRYPDVAEATVIGEPDPDKGEIITAIVVPSNGKLDVHALERHCAEHLGKQKRPKRIEIVKELPKNFLGKIQRRKLREARKENGAEAVEEKA